MTSVIHGPGPTGDHIHQLHEFLTARGWIVKDHGYPESSYPGKGDYLDPEWGWSFPASYSGMVMNQFDDITPAPLRCQFDLDDIGQLVVTSAGTWQGCADHIRWEAPRYPLGEGDVLDLEDLGLTLDDLEQHARALDPRVLVECLFFGPCGRKSAR